MTNYLIGFGERLARSVAINTGGGEKNYPWTFEEAKKRLVPQWKQTAATVAALDDLACPEGQTVISLTMHPDFLARSYYPTSMLRDLDLRAIGSRAKALFIEKQPQKKRAPDPTKPFTAPELFVAGDRARIIRFAKELPQWTPGREATADDFRKVHDVESLDLSRLKPMGFEANNQVPLEVVLHASEADDYIVEGFRAFATGLGADINLDNRIQVGGLCFLPMRAPQESLERLTAYSFVRVVRRMPRLALNDSVLRTSGVPGSFPVKLPDAPAKNRDVQVAIFDGGVPPDSPLAPWVRARDAAGVGEPTLEFQAHGFAVTSALLFGTLAPNKEAPAPYANVDHWRVLDKNVQGDDFELPVVLRRIMNVLRQRRYDFVSLSIGPSLPIEDNDVHAWTSSLDDYLANSDTVLTAACGNSGTDDWASGNARIQPPSDGVNVIGVGSATSLSNVWSRAAYSSIGQGRNPGFIKPDFLAFGGCHEEPFWTLDYQHPGHSAAKMGTSYSSPAANRSGVGVRAHFGGQLSAAAIKALMVHHSRAGEHVPREVGWGRVPEDTSDLVVCPDGEVTVVYQGILEPSQFIRFPIAVPRDPFRFDVTIKATFSIFTPVDPEDSINYTRAGLVATFRPSTVGHPGYGRTGKARGVHPSHPFFSAGDYHPTELQRRRNSHKWEPILRNELTFPPGTLNQPVFDVEHHARMHGAPSARRTDIRYALIISISSPDEPELFNRILAAYPTTLEILRPTIELPIKVAR